MRFLLYFRLSTYLLIASGYFALLITEDYGILAGLIFVLILVIGWRVDTGTLTLHFSSLWWNLTSIGVLLLCLADALFIRRIPSVALINFLIFLQMTKIFSPKQHRDYVTLYVISFFELLASSIMTMSIFFAFSCVLFAVSVTWALITLYLKKDIETHVLRTSEQTRTENGERHERIQHEQEAFNIPAVNTLLNRKFFVGTFGMTFFTLGMALVIFPVLPRMWEGSIFPYGTDLSQRVSGFSEEVALDSFGTIRLNHQPVMRVILPEDFDPAQSSTRLYWKGLTYSHYDGVRWRSDPKKRKHLSVRYRGRQLYWFRRQASTRGLLPQEFELASPTLEVLFGTDEVQAVEGRFLSLQHDEVTSNSHVIFDPQALRYTVYSDISTPSEEELMRDQREYPDVIKNMYLQIPELADRIPELARQIAGGYDNAYDQVVAIQEFLFQNYEYSLDVQRESDLPPLEDFLFVNKAGHCEYYATSMAILLRILGIPARVVNGFAQGRWNEFGHFFTVRQSDAHSWVEAYFPSYGWVTFDPTPGVAFGETYQQFAEKNSFFAGLYRYSESLRVRWNRYIVDFSREDQALAIVKAVISTHNARYNMRSWISRTRRRVEETVARISWREIGYISGVIAGGALLIYAASRILQRFRLAFPAFKTRKKLSKKIMIRFYHRMLHILSRKGITKEVTATPGEFVRYVTQNYSWYQNDVRFLTDLYYGVRYGSMELGQEDIMHVEHLLKRIKKQTVT